jgi:hypothetical protein
MNSTYIEAGVAHKPFTSCWDVGQISNRPMKGGVHLNAGNAASDCRRVTVGTVGREAMSIRPPVSQVNAGCFDGRRVSGVGFLSFLYRYSEACRPSKQPKRKAPGNDRESNAPGPCQERHSLLI